MRKRYKILAFGLGLSIMLCGYVGINYAFVEQNRLDAKPKEETQIQDDEIIEKEEIYEPVKKSITISAVGDCTIGTDPIFGYNGSFTSVFNKQQGDYGYFFRGVYDILSKDDLTIANLETTFTNSTDEAEKTFNFKGDASYVNILTAGSVEAVNLANNHTYDFKEQGYIDTISALESINMPYFGNDASYMYDAQGIKIGLLGYYSNYTDVTEKLVSAINSLKEQGAQLVVVSFHWGIEKEYQQNDKQRSLGKLAINSGADLVIGTHPHVIQGIEEYNGKYIIYSLANFVFGGNRNPKDKDTFIFQETFNYVDEIIDSISINIVPVSVSSISSANDYQPTILESAEHDRVLKKILKYSNITY